MRRISMLVFGLALMACARGGEPRAATPPRARSPAPSFRARMSAAARDLEPLVRSEWVRRFVRAASDLPPVAPTTIYRNESGTKYYSHEAALALAPDVRSQLWSRVADEDSYYNPPSSGTPLDYTRAFDLVAAAGFDRVSGKRILDFGYGGIGHLRMLATLGADVVGVDVDRTLLPLYASVRSELANVRTPAGPTGHVTMVEGRFPADVDVAKQVGERFDLVISKNVLKRGYIRPAEPVPPHQRVDLGVADDAFRQRLFDVLVPGGFLMIYNVYPPQGVPYRPWADGRSPWDRAEWERSGFRVVTIDQDDSAALRALGHAVGWDVGAGVVLERDFFAMYTLLQRESCPSPVAVTPRMLLR